MLARLLFSVCVLLLIAGCQCRVVTLALNDYVSTSTISDLTIAHFCYSASGGRFLASGNAGAQGQQLLFLDDSLTSFPAALASYQDVDCNSLSQFGRNVTVFSGNGAQGLGITYSWIFLNGTFNYSVLLPPSSTPTYWYVVVSNCASQVLDLNITMKMLNPGGFWTKQFSVDEQGLLSMYEVYIVFFSLLFVAFFWTTYAMWSHPPLRPMLALVLAAITLMLFFCVFNVIDGVNYGANGVGLPLLNGFAELLMDGSNLIIIFVFLCVAKGWKLGHPLPYTRVWGIGVAILLFVYLFVFVVERALRPIGQVALYQSSFGLWLALLRIAFFLYFCFLFRRTYKEESDTTTRSRQRIFVALASFWFLVLPFVVLISPAFPIYNRVRAVLGAACTVHMLTLSLIVVAFVPFRRGNVAGDDRAEPLAGEFLDTSAHPL